MNVLKVFYINQISGFGFQKMSRVTLAWLACVLLSAGFVSGTIQAQDLSGNWQGCWISQNNGHRGRMNATLCQNSCGQIEAKFRGTFFRVLPFRYRAKLDIIHQEPGMTVLSGSKKLGPIMGEFQYDAVITDGQFNGSFSAGRTYGNWTLHKRNACCQ